MGEGVVNSIWTSRKFLLPALGVALLGIVPVATGHSVNWDQIVGALATILGYLGAEQYKDHAVVGRDAEVIGIVFQRIQPGSKWLDPRFLITVSAVVVISILPQFGVNISWKEISPVVVLVVGWLASHGAMDAKAIQSIADQVEMELSQKSGPQE